MTALAAAAGSAPRFSVVVPAYNAAATLGRTLESVLAQTWPAHEIIVVDDGSSDTTAEVASRWGSRITCIRQANAGPSAARNCGVQAASGDWIAFIDADDWFHPDRLQAHAEMILADPALDFLVAGFDYADVDGRIFDQSLPHSMLGRRLTKLHGARGKATLTTDEIGEFIAQQFSDTRSLSLPRKTFVELGGFPLDLRICEDLVFMIRLCSASRHAGVVCSSLSVYVVHDAGLIRSNRLRAQTESVRALQTLRTELQEAPAPVRRAWQRLLKEAYRDLAYFLAKEGRKGEAMAGLMQSFRFSPSWRDGRDMLSVLKG